MLSILSFIFQPSTHKHMIRSRLEKRKQGLDEPTISYITDIITMCKKVNDQMPQDEVCGYILKGLLPDMFKAISMLDNSSLGKIKENLRKYDEMHFTLQSHRDNNLRDELINQVCTLTSQPMVTMDKFEALSEKINTLLLEQQKLHKEIEHLKKPTPRNPSFPQQNWRPTGLNLATGNCRPIFFE